MPKLQESREVPTTPLVSVPLSAARLADLARQLDSLRPATLGLAGLQSFARDAVPVPPIPHPDEALVPLLSVLIEDATDHRQRLCGATGKLILRCADRFIPSLRVTLGHCDDSTDRRGLAGLLARLGSTAVKVMVAWIDAYGRGEFLCKANAHDESIVASVSEECRNAKSCLQVSWVDLNEFRPAVTAAVTLLVEMLHSPDDHTRGAAKTAVTSIQQEVPTLIDCFQRADNPITRDHVLALSFRILPVSDQLVPVFAELLGHAKGSVRDAAVIALTTLGQNAEVIAPLAAALRHTDALVRQHAAVALGRIGKPARAAVPALIDVLLRVDEGEHVRATTAAALASLDPELVSVASGAIVPNLVAALRSPVQHVRNAATRLLSRIDPAALTQDIAEVRPEGLKRMADKALRIVDELELFYRIGESCRERRATGFSFKEAERQFDNQPVGALALSASSIGRHIHTVSAFFHEYFREYGGVELPADDCDFPDPDTNFLCRVMGGQRQVIGRYGWTAWEETGRYLRARGRLAGEPQGR